VTRFLNAEVAELEGMTDLLEGTAERREYQLRLQVLRTYDLVKRVRVAHRELRRRIRVQTGRYASLKAQLDELEDAIKRGALALSPGEWDAIRTGEKRNQLMWPRPES